jgi:hypothetical protein
MKRAMMHDAAAPQIEVVPDCLPPAAGSLRWNGTSSEPVREVRVSPLDRHAAKGKGESNVGGSQTMFERAGRPVAQVHRGES